MAITLVSSAEDTYFSATQIGSRTVAVDIGTRTNGLLVVGVSLVDTAPSRSPDVSGITWNGVALSKAADAVQTNGNSEYTAEVWYLANPANGSQNLVLTFAATNVTQLHVVVSWYDGAHQTQAQVLSASNTGTGTTDPSVSITPTVDGCVIVSQYVSEAADVLSVGSGETGLQNHDWGAQVSGSSYVIQTTAGAQTVDFTGADDYWAMAVAAFKPAATGSPVTVTPVAAAALATVTNPTARLGSLSVTPVAAAACGSLTAPSVVLGAVAIIPAIARALVSVVAPLAHLGATAATPTAAAAWATVADPQVDDGSEEPRRVRNGILARMLRPYWR